MKVIIFGATGMVGMGALRQALLDPGVERVLAIVRSPTGRTDAKLKEIVHSDFTNFDSIASEFAGYDVCLFCLGVSSAGMSEADYKHITYDYTLAAARTFARVSPGATFIYVSGTGTDSTEKGRSMWARVKGQTENALLKLPFKGAYMFRPGFIQPMFGVKSKTKLYSAFYAVLSPAYPLLKSLMPKYMTNTDAVARAMLHVARYGYTRQLLENDDINQIAAASTAH